jgi:hypothetical protein
MSRWSPNAWQHGAFTAAVLKALEGGRSDANHDGRLSFTELELFVKNEVFNLTQGKQNPSTHKPLTVSEIVLAAVR